MSRGMGAERGTEFPSLGMSSLGTFQETSRCYCLLLLKFGEINTLPSSCSFFIFFYFFFFFAHYDKQTVLSDEGHYK